MEQHPTTATADDDRHLAAGRGSGGQLRDGPTGGTAGEFVDVVPVEELEADGVPDALASGLHAGVAGGHAAHGEEGADGLVLGEQSIGVRHEDPTETVAVIHRDLADGGIGGPGDLVGTGEQLDLAGLGDLDRRDLDLVPTGALLPGEGDGAHAASTAASSCRRRLGRGDESCFGEVGGVGEPGGVAHDDSDAGTTITTGGELLHPAVIEQRG